MSRKKLRWKAKKIKIPTKVQIPTLRLRCKLLLYAMTILFALLSIVNVINEMFPDVVGILCYILAACTLVVSCYYLIADMKYGVKQKIKPGIEANPFTKRVSRDYRYRTVVFTVPGLILNIAFAIFNGVIGILSQSAWFGTLSAYYIILSLMRFRAVRYERHISKMNRTKEMMLEEISIYHKCGILLIIMTVALSGAVILMINSKGGKHYPGFTIFAVAAYTFYKIILSILNVIKAGKLKSPLLMTIRSIGYVDACVSILTLQTAMFAAFGEGLIEYEKWMNASTGVVVCLMVLFVGIRCIVSSRQMARNLSQGRF